MGAPHSSAGLSLSAQLEIRVHGEGECQSCALRCCVGVACGLVSSPASAAPRQAEPMPVPPLCPRTPRPPRAVPLCAACQLGPGTMLSPPPAALCHQCCHPCCWPRCTSRPHPRAVPGSPVPLPGTFPPVSVTSASERPRIADSGERSSCPLLYLLHLPNLMTGGMRSISNMASFAGSGQSTQEAFLHTPIPACSAAPVPSSPGHPAAACPCRGARRGARRGWWPWGPSRAPGSG